MAKSNYYIGLMSGTSMDGIDTVLVEFKQNKPLKLLQTLSHSISEKLRSKLIDMIDPSWKGSLSSIGTLHQELGELFADATNQLLRQTSLDKNQIQAIGSHGQTLWHQTDGEYPFSLQLGDANLIAELTGIQVVADFRSRDIAAGGQGAPLVPAFHQEIFSSSNKFRVILNIGGISNISILPPLSAKISVSGFDTGPGNTLSDSWIKLIKRKNYDHNGEWASTGKIQPEILSLLLTDPYFSLSPPKSTGKELFNIDWLHKRLGDQLYNVRAEDTQATLCELTAKTIAANIPENCEELYICGGGIHNQFLIKRLQKHLPPRITCASTQTLGINPDWVEAIAFAWLAKQTIDEKPGNLPAVTGAKGKRVLGAIYSAT